MKHLIVAAALPLAFLTGCSSGPPAIDLPHIDAEAAAQQALAEYDADRDGSLDQAELQKCPPLKHSLANFDSDGNQQLSAGEIADRLKTYVDGNAGLMELGCFVTLDGRPLPAARVELVPEKFLGPNIKPAQGVSDEAGIVRLQTEGMDLPGVNYGLFRVVVSLPGSAGQEQLPPRYNAETELGIEVTIDTLGRGGGLNIKLASQ